MDWLVEPCLFSFGKAGLEKGLLKPTLDQISGMYIIWLILSLKLIRFLVNSTAREWTGIIYLSLSEFVSFLRFRFPNSQYSITGRRSRRPIRILSHGFSIKVTARGYDFQEIAGLRSKRSG